MISKIGFLSILIAVWMAPSLGQAVYCPESNCRPAIQVGTNESYLRTQNVFTEPNYELRDKIIDPNEARKVRQKYEDLNRRYEMRTRYSIRSRNEQLKYNERMSGFSQYILRSIVSYQISEHLNKAEKHSEGVRTFRKVHDNVQKVVKGSMAVEVSEEVPTKVGANTNLAQQKGSVWMTSPLLDAYFDVDFGGNLPLDPEMLLDTPDPTRPDDRYRLTVKRSLPFRMMSSVSYGFGTEVMTSSVSRSITPNLSAEIADTRGFNPSNPAYRRPEEIVRVSYGLDF